MSETGGRTITARLATPDDLPGVAATLAAAFHDDPISVWLYPDDARRRDIGHRFFEIVARTYLPHGGVHTTDGALGAAVWVPPGVEDDDAALAALVDVSGEYGPRLVEMFELMGAAHPREPHHYLFLLGTRPERQGQGIGSALMRPVLEACDRDGIPAYLEATCERNQRLYLRHGFEVTGEIPLPGGPRLWPMWRDPR